MTKHIAKELLEKYLQGSCTGEEQAIVESWHLNNLEKSTSEPGKEQIAEASQTIWNSITAKVELQKRANQTKSKIYRYTSAAILFIVLSIGLLFLTKKLTKHPSISDQLAKTGKDFIPGGNKAILTLADGTKISLTDAINGKISQQAQITITKTEDGQIIYSVDDHVSANSEAVGKQQLLNTIATPRGGKYQIILPDGTTVWLNAQSSLTYPMTFNDSKRKVELTGEAYFEVTKNHKPFVVVTANQEVEVLGTHFNINSYADERSTKTTLLEGAVKVRQSSTGNFKILKPGEQAQVNATQAAPVVSSVDLESEMAWKNDLFIFKNEKIESIARKLSRWYDVDITFEGNPSNLSLVGVVSRTKNISSVLKLIEETGNVHFKVEGKKIIIVN
ncbi:FecR family protein [Pedobacter sp. MC2016-24]|uniref:FecR family protein n=1 Tax=Pedobacter sp. MC2016-24 TaxID=2780090 RepID=UPI0018826C31|nr:FecR domain-containing protein [Pedobacter sp. MC2016-24]MBE9599308.1 FecR family protein [Pedobacter sp. MC2016-24]